MNFRNNDVLMPAVEKLSHYLHEEFSMGYIQFSNSLLEKQIMQELGKEDLEGEGE